MSATVLSPNMTSARRLVALLGSITIILVVGCLLPPGTACAQQRFDANGQCVGDRNGDGHVSIDELITTVNNAMDGCQFMPVTLQFHANVGSAPFACGNIYHGIGTTNADIVPSDLRFYLHDIRLVAADGREVPLRLVQDDKWQHDNLVLLDFENSVAPCAGTPQTNSIVQGTIAPDTYTGVRFILGVPFNMNHQEEATAPSPLNLSGMFWTWQDGYKFLRIDTAFDNVRLHVGSTGCVYGKRPAIASCARLNLGTVNLDHFNPASNVIVADLAALLADSDLNGTPSPVCQSDPDDQGCAPMFKNLGINFSDGSPNPTSQKFFRVE